MNIKASFPVRRMDFQFAATPRYWFGGDAGLTHFLTSLSVLKPETPEAMRAIKGVGDSKLLKYGRAFLDAIKGKTPEEIADGFVPERGKGS